MNECSLPEIFQGRGGFVELGHFDVSGPTGKHFLDFSPIYSENFILNRKFNPKIDTIRAFLSKIRTIFSIFKKGRGCLVSSLVVGL